MATPAVSSSSPANTPPPVAWLWIGSAALTAFVALAVTAGGYGYHRDELYFRMLQPAWGYVDQPPLTPFVARLGTAVLGDTLWGMRLPAALCVAGAILLVALTTRELGGRRAAQAISAWGFASAAFPMLVGHILLTATVDLVVWAAVILFVVRALWRDAPRWWLAAGAVVGLSLFNKLLIVLLLVGLVVGLLAVGPRKVLRSPWLWAGAGLALLLGSPNLIFQATHGWPQAEMAAAITDDNGTTNRFLLLPFQLILIPSVIWIAGLVAVLKRPHWRPVRALGVAYLVVLAVVLITGGQMYYPFGLQAFLFAAGAIPTADWVARRPHPRRRTLIDALAISAAITVLIALPVLPLGLVGHTPIPAINQGTSDQIGWPAYVRTVADAYAGLSAADQARAVILVGNYGEAGAVARYGPAYGLPLVYSGHNELWRYGPPPADHPIALVWSQSATGPGRNFGGCERAGVMDNGVGVDNEEQGSAVWVCHDPIGGWAALWPRLRHLD